MSSLKERRKEKGLSQEQLAELVGCRRETIAKLEAGKHNPSLELADSLALVLDATIYELFSCRSSSVQKLRDSELRESMRETFNSAVNKFCNAYCVENDD